MTRLSLVVFGCSLTIGASLATADLVTTESGLVPTDTYHWADHGTSSVPNGTTLTTQHGVNFSASNPTNDLAVVDPSTTAFGTPGDATTDILVASQDSPQTMSFSFSSPLAAVGAYVQWGGTEPATYTLSAYGAGNTLLETESVKSDINGDWAFVGLTEPVADIDAITFTLTGETPPHSAALGDLFLRQTPAPVPEPALGGVVFALLLGLGVRSAFFRRTRSAVSKPLL